MSRERIGRQPSPQTASVSSSHCFSLLGAIDAAKANLTDLQQFSKDDWVVRYHILHEDESVTPSKTKPRRSTRRSLTFADDSASQTEIVYTPSRRRSTRALTLASTADAQEHLSELSNENAEDSTDEETFSDKTGDFNILRLLDGVYRRASPSPADIANVSHFVHVDTPMDSEAASHGTTVSLVDKLPPLLGMNLCSLGPHMERLAFGVI